MNRESEVVIDSSPAPPPTPRPASPVLEEEEEDFSWNAWAYYNLLSPETDEELSGTDGEWSDGESPIDGELSDRDEYTASQLAYDLIDRTRFSIPYRPPGLYRSPWVDIPNASSEQSNISGPIQVRAISIAIQVSETVRKHERFVPDDDDEQYQNAVRMVESVLVDKQD